MRNNLLSSALFLFVALAFSGKAYPTPDGLTFQGRLVDNGVAVEGNPVTLTLTIKSPGVNECVLFEETHSLNLTNSDGIFSVKIGGGARTGNDEGFSMAQVFSNTGAAINSLSCSGGVTTYTSSSTDSRNVYVSFVDGGNTVSFSSPYVIQSVPYAIEAQKLAGKSSSDFLQTVPSLETTPGTTQARMTRIVATDYSALDALLDGTSSQYMTTSNSGPTKLPVLSSAPMSPSAGQIWYEGGVLKYYDGVASQTRSLGTAASATTLAGYGITDAVKVGGQAGALSLGTTDANALSFNTNNSAKMTILSSGNVGIGSATPNGIFEVQGGTAAASTKGKDIVLTAQNAGAGNADGGNIILTSGAKSGTGAQGSVLIGYTLTPVWMPPNSLYVYNEVNAGAMKVADSSEYAWGDGSTKIYGTAPTGYLSFHTSGAEQVRINSSGNVGIGTTAPGTSLDLGSKTDSLRLPAGTTAQRPAAPVNGDIRYNTSTQTTESFINGSWRMMTAGAPTSSGSFRQVGTNSGMLNAAEQESYYAFGQADTHASNQAATSTLSAGMIAAPFIVTQQTSIDRLAFSVLVAGAAGSKVRIAIYNNAGPSTLYPGTLLLDAGEHSADAVGVVTATVSATLPANSVVWGVIWGNAGGGTPFPTFKAVRPDAGQVLNLLGWDATLSVQATNIYYSSAYTSGTPMPATFPAGAIRRSGNLPLLFMRFN